MQAEITAERGVKLVHLAALISAEGTLGIDYRGDEEKLIEALTSSGWVEDSVDYRRLTGVAGVTVGRWHGGSLKRAEMKRH